jgi:hypothetical protein
VSDITAEEGVYAALAFVVVVGAGSQLAWFVQSAVGVNITRNTSMEIGYRYLYFNYVGSQLSLESDLPGVYSGVIFRF